MALRRVLPSRASGATAQPEPVASAGQSVVSSKENMVPPPVPQPSPLPPPAPRASETELAAAAVSAFGTPLGATQLGAPEASFAAPVSLPEPAPAPQPAPKAEIPAPAAPARVLESSFIPPAGVQATVENPAELAKTEQPAEPKTSAPEEAPVAAPAVPAEPEKPVEREIEKAPEAPAPDVPPAVPAEAVKIAAQTVPQPALQPQAEVFVPEIPEAKAPVQEAVPAPVATERVETAVKPEPETPEPSVSAVPETPAPAKAQPEAPAPAQPSGPTDFLNDPGFTPSRPEENPFKRKVGKPVVGAVAASGSRGSAQGGASRPESRPAPASPAAPARAPSGPAPASAQPTAESQPAPRGSRVRRERDFAAATIAEPEKKTVTPAEGTKILAEKIPVSTRPLDRVDEELIASGILAPKNVDTLVSNVPVSLAVAESPFLSETEDLPAPAAAPVVSSPAPARKPAPAPVQAPAREPKAPAADISVPLPATSAKPSLPEKDIPLPEIRSDLPWVNQGAATEEDWEVETPAADVGAPVFSEPLTQSPPADIFKEALASGAPAGPAWSSANRAGVLPPPEIQAGRGVRSGGTGSWLGFGLVGAAVLVGVFIWYSGGQQSQLQEKISSLTGSLSNQEGALAGGENGDAVKPEGSFAMAEISTGAKAESPTLLPPPPDAEGEKSTAQIDFKDVPPEQAGKTIAADGTEKMPEDVSLFARFQQAVNEARAQKQGGSVSSTMQQEAKLEGEEKLTPEQLQQELAAYRRLLVDAQQTGEAAIKPSEFNRDPQGYMDGQPLTSKAGSAAPGGAMAGASGGAQGALLPPPDLYTNNPKNLPVVGEPLANSPAKVRTLADFPEAQPYEPERERVRIPRGLRPSMAVTDFPSLEVLSFVPQKGIIAFAGGKEGVLLIGESLAGWELTNVTPEMAEFRAGQKKHYVTAQD